MNGGSPLQSDDLETTESLPLIKVLAPATFTDNYTSEVSDARTSILSFANAIQMVVRSEQDLVIDEDWRRDGKLLDLIGCQHI